MYLGLLIVLNIDYIYIYHIFLLVEPGHSGVLLLWRHSSFVCINIKKFYSGLCWSDRTLNVSRLKNRLPRYQREKAPEGCQEFFLNLNTNSSLTL